MRTEAQKKRLKKWLVDLDMTQRKIARECGVTQALVSQVVNGKRKNQKVIDFFLSKGCPRDLLEDSREFL